ncbi:M1 family metallopeptidase [Reichenbachiella carrageenanivorans]|uniref:Aminopeptidase N n=1 Tax=Reichenbachiella carrageenanivorans TaxID=2979869 RepID=A0ABY6DBC6_9BACT|nr:M1 family metallopeptidase [Reichenbachiella carrageenanivorans]UXX81140.1 M1 family metallopeptidase [Reichenbachiella carrageenanivorans]
MIKKLTSGLCYALCAILLVSSCTPGKEYPIVIETDMKRSDTHSFAHPEEAVVTHLSWHARVNFELKKIDATATLTIKSTADAKQLVLDTKDLTIKSITNGNNEALNFSIGETQPFLGAPLTINITPKTKNVLVSYETSENAEALQWLEPSQTTDKSYPFLFTQSQAILARSWVPIQDSPGIRFTYDAQVEVPKELLALMSASNPTEKNESGIYTFEMKQAIPAYLLALAVGDVQFSALGKRSGVYAEPSVLAQATAEFEDLEKMISAAEKLYGPYRWDRYDLIVLPSSFPFGGMENPRLTFATPTILAGDKSLTSLVAHELAHSWSGNLVTNANWNDFWLNEGFTVYFEYRIMEALYGREYSEMLALLSLQDLKTEIEEMKAADQFKDTSLKFDLTNRNPDDGMTSIPYDKGYFFLRMLEEKVGREKFDGFLKDYFTSNSFKTMTTEQFTKILQTQLFDAYDMDVQPALYEAWIYTPGLPADCPNPVSDKFENVDKALTTWLANQSKEELQASYHSDDWSTHEWLRFIRNLPDTLSTDQMQALDQAFGFTATGNSEIFNVWGILIIANQYEAGYGRLESFLIHTGRRKFLMPLYKEFVKTPEGIEMAKAIYQKARPNYHFVASSSIDALLGL